MAPYFQDVYDHVLRATEWTDSLRDLIGNIYDTHLTVRGNRLNVDHEAGHQLGRDHRHSDRVTGFYGQNVPYPGFARHSGFITSSAITLIAVVALYAMFRKKGWL